MKKLLIAIALSSTNAFLNAAALGSLAAGRPDEVEPTGTSRTSQAWCAITESEPGDLIKFNVNRLVADIAESLGVSYDAFTSLETHPGPEVTKKLIKDMLLVMIQKDSDQLAFISGPFEALKALPENQRQNKAAYRALHPFFDNEESYKCEPARWYDLFLRMLDPSPVRFSIEQIRIVLEYLDSTEFNWDEFLVTSTQSFKGYLLQRIEGRTAGKLFPNTTQVNLSLMFSEGNMWDLSVATRSIAYCSSAIMRMRLCLAHVTSSVIAKCKSDWIFLKLDEILYPKVNELEHNFYDPDTLIIKFAKRQNRILAKIKSNQRGSAAVVVDFENPSSAEEIELWKKIEANHRQAMPKSFGTSARKQVEETKLAAKKAEEAAAAFFAELGDDAPKKLSRKQKKALAAAKTGTPPEQGISSSCIPLEYPVSIPCASQGATHIVSHDIRDITLRLVDRMQDAAPLMAQSSPSSFKLTKWVKHETEERYTPKVAATGAPGKFRLTNAQKETLNAIRAKIPFSFNMEAFLNLMKSLGINCSGQKGSHLHIDTPGELKKIFVDPHGWTDKFGPGATSDMYNLINALSLGEGSEYLEVES